MWDRETADRATQATGLAAVEGSDAMVALLEVVSGVEVDARLFLETAHDPVLIFDPDGEIVLDVNERACETYGFARDVFIGKSLRDISGNCAWGERHVRATLEGRHSHAFRTIHRRSDGSELVLDVRARPLDWCGRRAILSINRDITDDVAMVDYLVDEAEEWQITVDSLHAALVLVDARGTVIRANTHAETVAEAANRPAIVGRRIHELSAVKPWDRVGELVETALAQREPVTAQVTDLTEGTTWEIGVTVAASANRRTQAVAIVRDISARKSLEASLRRNENMAAIGRLVAGVAHEVRNPLFIISATVDALHSRLPEVDETAQQLRRNLGGELHRLTALMNDLLDYAKPPALNAVVDTLYDVIDDAIATAEMHGTSKSESVRIVNAFPLGTGRLLMDRFRMTQAIRNILDNALHYSPHGGEVMIAGRALDREDGSWIVCSVDDAGPGFPAGDLSAVFEPFHSRRPGGTGLGLSIVQRTIELHGGTIRAENRVGGGARVTIELPRIS